MSESKDDPLLVFVCSTGFVFSHVERLEDREVEGSGIRFTLMWTPKSSPET